MRWIPLAAIVLAVLPAVEAAPVPKHLMKDEPFWPTEVGTKWVFDVKCVDRVEEIVEVEDLPTSKLLTVRVQMSTVDKPWELTYEVSGSNVIYRKLTTTRVDEMLLRFPVRADDSWDVKHQLQDNFVAQTGRATVGRTEKVKVPAGTFLATNVTVKVTELNGKAIDPPRNNVFWYARGIGPVKVHYDLDGCVPQELKSFTPGKK